MTAPARPMTPNDGFKRDPDQAGDGTHSGRDKVADGIESVATRITAGGEHVAQGAKATADKMSDSATWLRDTSSRDMMNSFEAMIKEHPGRTVLGAVAVGFLAGRMLRGD
ncbi:MAG: hypothetical protein ABR551_08300 [Gemmatimonadales bacterium]